MGEMMLTRILILFFCGGASLLALVSMIGFGNGDKRKRMICGFAAIIFFFVGCLIVAYWGEKTKPVSSETGFSI